jgi:hypothetical protein
MSQSSAESPRDTRRKKYINLHPTMAAVDFVQCFDQKKTTAAVYQIDCYARRDLGFDPGRHALFNRPSQAKVQLNKFTPNKFNNP